MIASGTGDRVAIEDTMKTRGLTIPEIMLIGGTRVALGAGVGAATGVFAGHIAIWLAVGIAIGVAIGSSLRGNSCAECEVVHEKHQAKSS